MSRTSRSAFRRCSKVTSRNSWLGALHQVVHARRRSPRARSFDFQPRRHVNGTSVPVELCRSPRALRPTRSRTDEDASDRLLQPTFQRRALSLSTVAGSLAQQAVRGRLALRFNDARPASGQLISAPRRAFSTRTHARRLAFWRPVAVWIRCSHASGARARIQPTKVASPAAPLRATAFPTQDTFHRQAALASRVDPTVGNTVVRAPAPIRPWRDDRSGLGLVVRPQPRPRTTPETRRLLPTSATM